MQVNNNEILKNRILQLAERFSEHRDSYRSGKYNETQVRREFLDPFFESLGWDVNNNAGFAESYKDVIHEDAVKVKTGKIEATKAPDYSFRIGGQRKFFLEAKKPSVNIKDDIGPAFQLRRYGWSAGLSLSVLSDFEEFAIYDTSIRPDPKDGASVARIFYCTFDEYDKHWDWLFGIFSKDAILKGSFDKFARDSKGKKGTSTVDREFLKEIESWRMELAKNIALRNQLDVRSLNYSVQTTIDRLLFLRICEDRGIEEYGQLSKITDQKEVYKNLKTLYNKADQKYNSGLFHFEKEKGRNTTPDELTMNLEIDDKVFKDIVKRLYYPESPYEFSVIGADILGNVYEQFLGKVIRLKGKSAVVEEKPQVKKAGGVYYTPKYIVEYIVENTLGEKLKKMTPKEVAGEAATSSAPGSRKPLRILDPACGSGSFLIHAYQYLLDWHLQWYTANNPAKYKSAVYQGALTPNPSPTGRGAGVLNPTLAPPSPSGRGGPNGRGEGTWHLTGAEKKKILVNNIFGVDIDNQAVEVTKLNLMLKVLENENAETLENQYQMFHERALPDLGNNIKCGNSLIGSDFYTFMAEQKAGQKPGVSSAVIDKRKSGSESRGSSGGAEWRGTQQALFELTDDEKYNINVFDWEAEFPSPPFPLSQQERGGKLPVGLVQRARELRKNQTSAEEFLWDILRDRQVDNFKFRRQHPLKEGFILDFYCVEKKLGIELDAGIHNRPDIKEYDILREKIINELGIQIIRIPNEEVFTDIEKVLEKITAAPLTPRLSGAPLPMGEGLGVEGVGFDIIIGNPPYVRQETLGENFKKYAQTKFETFAGTADLYVYFIEKSLSLLNKDGLYSIIVANKWMRANYGDGLRNFLKKKRIHEIIDFGDLPVFQNATTYPVIIKASNDTPKDFYTVKQDDLLLGKEGNPPLKEAVKKLKYKVSVDSLEKDGWSLSNEAEAKLMAKLKNIGKPLGEYVEGKIFYGIKTGLNEAFVIDEETKNRLIAEDPKSVDIIKPFLEGKDIKRFQQPVARRWLILLPSGITNQKRGNEKADKWLENTYPPVYKWLKIFEDRAKRRSDQGDYWWELRSCAYYDEFENNKLLLPDISIKGNFTFDTEKFYSVNTSYIIPCENKSILGILNSTLITWFYTQISAVFRGGYLRWIFQYVEQLPIRTIDFSNPTDKAMHDQMVSLVDRMLDLNKRLPDIKTPHEKTACEREIAATDKQIDQLVYRLYDLTPDEIEIVEQ
jgi:very-short-patch-repair endonuclease/type I restriction-modification system DNA methylase subunit